MSHLQYWIVGYCALMVKINRLICCNRKFFVPDFKLSPKPFGLIRRQLYSKFKRELVKLTTTLYTLMQQ